MEFVYRKGECNEVAGCVSRNALAARLAKVKVTKHETDSELKGRWSADPPAEKWPFFGVLESRRVGASRCLSVARGCASVDSTQKKSRNFFLARLG